MTWRWLALRPEPPADAALVIPVADEAGVPVGAIAAWGQEPDRP